MKRNFVLLIACALLAGAAGLYFGTQRFTPQAPQTAATAQLYGLTLPDLGGAPQALSQWRGKALVVNFWATWCAPCVEEMPELNALQAEWRSKDIQIIGLGIDKAANMAEFSKKWQIDYPLYVAGMGGSELSRLFGNQAGGLPFTVLIDAAGRVQKTYLGRLKMDELRRDAAAL